MIKGIYFKKLRVVWIILVVKVVVKVKWRYFFGELMGLIILFNILEKRRDVIVIVLIVKFFEFFIMVYIKGGIKLEFVMFVI